tara:strand:- start:1484 stop:2026 length:543 start_codon:yes stop_codon:yes gene_type:complete
MFLLPQFCFLSLVLTVFSTQSMATDFLAESPSALAEESEGEPLFPKVYWEDHPCLAMLARDIQESKKKEFLLTFQHRGGENLEKIAKDERAKGLDDEGLKWKKRLVWEDFEYKNSQLLQTVWTTSLCRGIEQHPRNAYCLSYADLYSFYGAKNQFKEGTSLRDLWNAFFLNKTPDSSPEK